MEDRRLRTVSMETMPRVVGDINESSTVTPAGGHEKKPSIDGFPSPKSVMSSPNVLASPSSTAKKDPFKFSKILNFKDEKKVTEDRSAEAAAKKPSPPTTAPSTDADIGGGAGGLTGVLSVHLRAMEKKRLFNAKTKFRVVAHVDKPTVELYTYVSSCSRQDKSAANVIPAYMLSLCKGSLVIEPKDGAFALTVHTWTKHTTIHYRVQTFVFQDDKPDRLREWTQCLTRAIAGAAQYDDGGNIFRTTLGLGDDVLHDETHDDGVDEASRLSDYSSDDDNDAVTRALRKLNPFSPTTNAQAKKPCKATSPTSLFSPRTSTHSAGSPTSGDSSGPRQLLQRAFQSARKDKQMPPTSLPPPLLPPLAPAVAPPHPHAASDDEVGHMPPPPVIAPTQSRWTSMSMPHLVERSSGLVLSLVLGWSNTSLVVPVALAGLYAQLSDGVGYGPLLAAFVAVHAMAACGLVSGVCMVAFVLLLLQHVDAKQTQRRQIRAAARALAAAEKANFAHSPLITLPSWIKFSDVERVEWLNTAIARGWPYIKVAIRNSVLYYVNPLLETNTPAMLTSMVLTGLDMGETAPSLGGVKCIPHDDALPPSGPVTEISFDAEVRFVAGESQLAELKLISHVGGAAARVRLKDAVISGTMRITLRPMATVWPAFRSVVARIASFVAFLTKGCSGISLSFIRLHTTIHDMIVDNLVWPKVLEVPFWDPALYPVEGVDDVPLSFQPSPPSSPAVSATVHATDDKKSIYGPGVVSLHVCTLVLRDMPPSLQLYAVFTLGQTHKTETRPVDDAGVCSLDEKYEFYWDSAASPVLHVQVWQHSDRPDRVMGTTSVDVGQLATKKDHAMKVELVEMGACLYLHVCRRLFSTVYPRGAVTAPKKCRTSHLIRAKGWRISVDTLVTPGLGLDVCVGMLFVTLDEVVWTQEDDQASFYGVFACEKQRMTSTTQPKAAAAARQEMFSFFIYGVDAATLTVDVFEKAKRNVQGESVGSISKSVLDLRKRLTTNQESFTETFLLQKPSNDGNKTPTVSVTLMFQWRQLMS
ncbi:Aste57867_14177 [Aphanomyces stellatus]|uniref:Aste57867_14177 protein n=1 Tax=Aphanomyces stellatus TaxID=120398 RepID=A0A485KZZ6_9STRA|nr:hypothetical protein As57867_014126 [Aphanomyces stellatus]VFT91002.1 Aste57867_14177 [Aphanomyces stellatus]